MPWLRLWVDVLDDPDLSDLPEATCWCWTLMLAAAKKYNRDGELPQLKTLAHWMRKPRDRVARVIVELTEAGLIESHDGVISIHGWSRWQMRKDITNAARQANYRARKRTASHAGAHAGNSETETDTETEAKALRNAVTEDRNDSVTALREHASAPTHDEKTTGRTGEEHRLFLEVIEILERHEPTKNLASQLIMAADSPEIRGFPSWMLWVGAIIAQRPDKSKRWGSFLAFCRNATKEEHARLKTSYSQRGETSVKAKLFPIIREGMA